MLRLRGVLDLLLVGFIGLAVIGAFLLLILVNRVCLVVEALRDPDGILQAPQRLNHK